MAVVTASTGGVLPNTLAKFVFPGSPVTTPNSAWTTLVSVRVHKILVGNRGPWKNEFCESMRYIVSGVTLKSNAVTLRIL